MLGTPAMRISSTSVTLIILHYVHSGQLTLQQLIMGQVIAPLEFCEGLGCRTSRIPLTSVHHHLPEKYLAEALKPLLHRPEPSVEWGRQPTAVPE